MDVLWLAYNSSRSESSIERVAVRTFQPVELWPTYAQATEARKRYAREGSTRQFGARILTFDAWAEELWGLQGDGRAFVSAVERDAMLAALAARCDELASGIGTVRLLGSIVRQGSGLSEFEHALHNPPAEFAEAERAVVRLLSQYRALLVQAGLAEPGEVLGLLPDALSSCAGGWDVTLREFDELAEGARRFLERLEAAGLARVTGMPPRGAAQRADDAFGADEINLACPELRKLIETIFYHAQDQTVEPQGAVRFALPMGRYAAPPLLARTITELVEEARAAREEAQAAPEEAYVAQGEAHAAPKKAHAVPKKAHAAREEAPDGGRAWSAEPAAPPAFAVVVSCARPLRMFEDTAERLTASGVSVAVQGSRPFKETAFGRAFLSLARFVHEDDAVRTGSMLTDFMESPFSGVTLAEAQKFDAAWRADRDLAHDATALLQFAAEQSEWAALMVEVAQDGDAVHVRPLLERLVSARADWSDALRAEQLQAIAALCETGGAAQRFGVPFSLMLDLLAARPVSVGASTGALPDVLICDERHAAQLAPGAAFALVSADMTAADSPVRTERGAKEALFEKLDIPPAPDALARSRARFARVLAVPRGRLVLSRPLNTVDADEQYPSVLFEEALDCYRADITADDDLDRTFGVPACLLPFVASQGEDAVHEAVERFAGEPGAAHAVEHAPTGVITPDRRESIVVSRIESGPAAGLAALSATQVESYLECPYKWFALRRLRLDTPDAGFGAMEMGILVHRVMSAFYGRLQQDDPAARVTPKTREKARALAGDVFWECFDTQRAGSSTTRVAPQGELEMAQVRELAGLVEDFAAGDADFLPGFMPRYAEWEFGGSRPVVYAGHALRGSIDRIDVDEKGRAVVVDYKGGIGSGANAPYLLVPKSADEHEGFVLPGKVQALMYAQIARRELGLDVVGAVYANYSKGTAAGAVDDTVVDPACARMEGPARQRSCLSQTGFASFGELLDEVEARVAAALERLAAGDIAAAPTTPDACAYCPVTVCDKRTA